MDSTNPSLPFSIAHHFSLLRTLLPALFLWNQILRNDIPSGGYPLWTFAVKICLKTWQQKLSLTTLAFLTNRPPVYRSNLITYPHEPWGTFNVLDVPRDLRALSRLPASFADAWMPMFHDAMTEDVCQRKKAGRRSRDVITGCEKHNYVQRRSVVMWWVRSGRTSLILVNLWSPRDVSEWDFLNRSWAVSMLIEGVSCTRQQEQSKCQIRRDAR